MASQARTAFPLEQGVCFQVDVGPLMSKAIKNHKQNCAKKLKNQKANEA